MNHDIGWHIDDVALARYRSGELDRVTAVSVEAHVTACDTCRGYVSLDTDRLDRLWAGVADRVEPAGPDPLEQVLRAVGVPAHLARVAAVGPSLRMPFVAAVVAVMTFGVVAAAQANGEAFALFLALAPLVPVAGVALVYATAHDPIREVALAAPLDSFRLLLGRAVMVLAVAVLAGLAAWPFVAGPWAAGFWAWLLPGLALALGTLALSSRWDPWVAASTITGGWVVLMIAAIGVLDTRLPVSAWLAFGTRAQIGYLVVAVLSIFIVHQRRDHFRREGNPR